MYPLMIMISKKRSKLNLIWKSWKNNDSQSQKKEILNLFDLRIYSTTNPQKVTRKNSVSQTES